MTGVLSYPFSFPSIPSPSPFWGDCIYYLSLILHQLKLQHTHLSNRKCVAFHNPNHKAHK